MKTKHINPWRWHRGESAAQFEDELVAEEPLEIRVDTRPISVTMRTPGHDEELAVGFLLTEGLIQRAEDVAKIQPYPRNADGNVVNVFLASHVAVNYDHLTRHVFAASSCGLCGKATIDAVHQHFKPVKSRLKVSAELLLELPARMKKNQAAFGRTGGVHAAALFTAQGDSVVVREDVGRHNAVDKVLGFGLLNHRLPFRRHILLVSGRASFEIMQKALAAGIPIVAAISAPSDLAVRFAEESGQTLIGFLRNGRMNVYSRPERVQFS